MKRQYIGVVAILGIAAFLFGPSLAHAAVPVPLGTTRTYGVVSGTFTNTAVGTSINGTAGQPALCYSTGPATPATVTGDTIVPCPAQVGLDQAAATANLNAQANATCTNIPDGVNLDAIDIGGGPGHFTPGCYTRAGALTTVAGGIVFLDAPGVYIFRSTGGGLTTGANSTFTLAAGVCESDVNWGLAGAATLGANTRFVGNILDAAGITLGQNATLDGRALAFGGTVTVPLTPVTINVPTCVPAAVCDIITLEPAALPGGTLGIAYGETVSASGGGETTYTYTVGSGLPDGLTLDPDTGEISGTPTAEGTFNFTVTGTDDATLCLGTQDYTIVIAAAAAAIPALDFLGLALLAVLLAGVGMFVVNKFSV